MGHQIVQGHGFPPREKIFLLFSCHQRPEEGAIVKMKTVFYEIFPSSPKSVTDKLRDGLKVCSETVLSVNARRPVSFRGTSPAVPPLTDTLYLSS